MKYLGNLNDDCYYDVWLLSYYIANYPKGIFVIVWTTVNQCDSTAWHHTNAGVGFFSTSPYSTMKEPFSLNCIESLSESQSRMLRLSSEPYLLYGGGGFWKLQNTFNKPLPGDSI